MTEYSVRPSLRLNMKVNAINLLERHGVQPSAHRVAVAECVLNSCDHPTAEKVALQVRKVFPVISRATIYNTLNLLVEKGLLRQYVLDDGKTVFDANVGCHHHFVDEGSGRVYDIPWDSLKVSNLESLKDFDVTEYQVVVRGKLKKPDRKRR